MGETVFWTDKRLEAVSRTSLTLFQGFLLSLIVGGVLGKVETLWLKILFIIGMIGFLVIGIVLADRVKKNKEV